MNVLPFEILFEDSHVLVCVKPSGIATQGRNVDKQDMVSLLKNYIAGTCPDSCRGREPYLAVIHRLDQPVRGIMVFARTPFAARGLSRELAEEGFEKRYRALVAGKPPERAGIIENYLVKDARTNTSRICKKETAGAKYARLSYQVVEKPPYLFRGSIPDGGDKNVTEIDIRLYTGRHHQIRVQMAGIGCPVAGDSKYNPEVRHSGKGQELKLCSCMLKFTHPKTKEKMCFSLL